MVLIVLILATWRLSTMLVNEEGPYLMFVKMRRWLGVRYDENSQRVADTEIGKAFNCEWCLSVWIGVLWTLLAWAWPVTLWVALPFALSGGAILLDEVRE